MLVERTNYFARPGRVKDVLDIRRRASEIRVRLGLRPGTITLKVPDAESGPDVQWECGFGSPAAHEADMRARAASPEFEAVRGEMRSVVERFERHLIRRDVAEGAAGWAADLELEGVPIVPRPVTIGTSRTDLAGYLFLPPTAGPVPCMIVNHGSGLHQGSTELCKPSVASRLMSWGIACLYSHRWGYGGSPGTPWRDEVTAEHGSAEYDRLLTARLGREADDVVAALHFLEGVSEIAPDHIGVMGSSFGGIVTVLAAARCARLRCAVDFAGAAMNWERTPRLRRVMIEAAEGLTAAIFLIQAANDYSTAPTTELAGVLTRAGKTHAAKVFPPFGVSEDEGHLFERFGSQIWGSDVRRFLERHL